MSHVDSYTGPLLDWFESNGYAGWDPYDLREHPLYRGAVRLEGGSLKRALRKIAVGVFEVFPGTTRRMLGIPKRIYPKAMGLLLSSFSDLNRIGESPLWLEKARETAEWLLEHRNADYGGIGWGYPFSWESPVLIPPNTPSSVVSVIVGDGFYRLYRWTGEKEYFDTCRGICEFLLRGLRQIRVDEEALCLSYTPLDDYQVHNANLLSGEFLARIGKADQNDEYLDAGRACANFALRDFDPEKGLPYWSSRQYDRQPPKTPRNDHYHVGFEIRALYGLWKHTGDSRIESVVRAYFEWYRKRLFEDGFIPKMNENTRYPVDIHACAEAILCPCSLGAEVFSRERARVERTIEWVHRTMGLGNGCYRYRIRKIGPLHLKSDISFVRWGAAWMLRALSRYARVVKENDE